jgi:integral membrane protein
MDARNQEKRMIFPPTAMMIRIFRGLAIAEAFSWAALLFGMVLKWVTKTTELGVEIAGPIHGAFFIGYAIAALSLWAKLRWPFRVALLSGLSAVLPFATIWFERWAGRRGHLNATGAGAATQGSDQSDVSGASERDDDTVSTGV